MTMVHYTAKVKSGLLLELPTEARELHLKPGDEVEVQLERTRTNGVKAEDDPTIALLESWIAEAPTDPEAIREAEEDLREFKRNMNLPRKESGARLHYPEVE
jgi:hypothetical protein